MSLTAEPDLDIEALFEAELAGLADENLSETAEQCLDASGLRLSRAGDGLGWGPCADALATNNDDDDDDDDDHSDYEPDSFHLLRAAFQRREHALDEFGRDLELVQQEFAGVSSGLPISPADAIPRSGAESRAATAVSTPSVGSGNPHESGGDRSAAPGQDTAGCTHAASEGEHRASTLPVGGAFKGTGGTPHNDDAATVCSRPSQVEVEEQASPGQMEMANVDSVPAEEASREEELRKEVEEQQRQALMALEAELAAAVADREAQLAEAQAERERLVAEREATRLRLEAVALEAADRAAARGAMVEALRREALELACRHMAAWRIGRAWRRHRAGRQQAAREQAVVVFQAAWRACVGRRRAAELRRRRDAMAMLEDAARRGRMDELHTAVERAKELGLNDAAQMRVAELESAGKAAAQLSAAATGGNFQEFRAALVAAQACPQLASVVAESCLAFERRQKEAEAAMWQAADGEPMSQFIRLLDGAGALGVDPQRCKAALETVRQRDAKLAGQLAWAAAAQGAAFDAAAFEVLLKRGTKLGLKGDVAAARHAVDRRRRAVAADLRERSCAASATELEAMAVEARRLGMEAEAQQLEQLRLERQQSMQAELQRAAAQASAPRFIALVHRAPHCGVRPDVLQAAGAILGAHRDARQRELEHAATAGAMPGFLAARGAAVVCGLGLTQLLAADKSMQARRRATVNSLVDVARRLTHSEHCAVPQGPAAGLAGEMGQSLGLGVPAAVLGRAAGRLLDGSPGCTRASGAFTVAGDRGLVETVRAQPQRPQQRPPDGGASCNGYPAACAAGSSHPQAVGGPGASNGRPHVAPVGSHVGAGGAADGPPAETREALWDCCVSALQLGLHDSAVLALCAMDVHLSAQLAHGLVMLHDAIMNRDYWGLPVLKLQQPSANTTSGTRDLAAASSSLSSAAAASSAATPQTWQPGGDQLAMRALQRMRQSSSCKAVTVWRRQCTLKGLGSLLASRPPQSIPVQPGFLTPLVSSSAHHSGQRSPAAAVLPSPANLQSPPKPSERSRPLTRDVLLRNAPAATPPHGAAAGANPSGPDHKGFPHMLHRVARLDLVLERLSGLAGLDAMCPALRVLHASNNELTCLDGLQGLSRLRELALRDNLLTGLQRSAGGPRTGTAAGPVVGLVSGGLAGLPAGTALRRLALDSNRLAGQLNGLAHCSGLRSLSLAQNGLTDVGTALESCAAGLTSLVLRSNCLAGPLSGVLGVVSLTALQELDVSGNRLASLDGVESLLLLQSLSASSNELTDLPQPLYLPHLTSLDLSNNALTAFADSRDAGRGGGGAPGVRPSPPPVVLPSLRTLVLTENRIARLGQLGSMPHLTSLDLSFNNLTSLDSLDALLGLTALLHLNIGDNPATRHAAAPPQLRLTSCPYRRKVLVRLPSLRSLDHEDVSDDERAQHAVYGAQATALTAAATMRALRAGGTCGLVHRQPRKAGSLSVTYSVAYSDNNGSSGGGSGGGAGNQRAHVMRAAAPSAARATPRLCYTSVCPGAVRGCDPSAVARLLSAPTSAAGCSPGALGFGSSCVSVAVAEAGSGVPDRSIGAPGCWRAWVDRLWVAAMPYDQAERHRRQLEEGQRLGAELRDSPALAACQRTPSTSHSLAHLPLGRAAAWAASAPAGTGMALLDAPHGRSLQPVARALRSLTAAPARTNTASADATAATAVAATAEGPKGAGRQAAAPAEKVALPPAAEAVAAEAEARYEEARVDLGRRLADDARGLLSKLRDSDRAGGSDGITALRTLVQAPVPQPSFLLRRLTRDADAVAATLQAWWRGVRARRALAGMRSEAHQAARHAAAIMIQAWWRGHQVRNGGELAALRREAQAIRQANLLEEARRREAAAVKIQAYYRGHRVRMRLRAALASARRGAWASGASPAEDPDLDLDLGLRGSGDLEDMMAFLRPLEDMFAQEEAEARARQQQQQPAPPLPLVAPGLLPAGSRTTGGVMAGAATLGLRTPAAAALAAGPDSVAAAPVLGPVNLPQGHSQRYGGGVPAGFPGPAVAAFPSPLQSPMSAGAAPFAAPTSAGTLPPLMLPGGANNMWAMPARGSAAYPQPQSSAPDGRLLTRQPSPGVGGMQGRPELQVDLDSGGGWGDDPDHQGDSDGGKEVVGTPGSACSPGGSTPDARRGKRHLERLQALMAEWGFKDLATAEAYYRRTLRQKQGQNRKKLQDKYRDPAQRLHKLQQAVQTHDDRGGPPPPPHGPARSPAPRPAPSPAAAHTPQIPGSAPGPGSQPRGPGGHLWPPLPGSGQRASPARPSIAGSEGTCVPARPVRGLTSADSVLTGVHSNGAVPSGGLPLIHRSNSHTSGSPAHSRPAVRNSGGGGVSESHVLPPLANNWINSPSQTPPGSGGSGAAALRGPLQVTAAPTAVRWRAKQP